MLGPGAELARSTVSLSADTLNRRTRIVSDSTPFSTLPVAARLFPCIALRRRPRGPFIKVNCGGLPETFVESERFGHEKDALVG
ncbi:MAG: sigma 54-interacting transcriptional regulator [Desulfosarcinaceae bacterium]